MPTLSNSPQREQPSKPKADTKPVTATASHDPATPVSEVNQRYGQGPTGTGGRLWLWTIRVVGQVRRQILSRLRPGYVKHARTLRRGKCRCCGSCCDLTFHCPYLSAEKGCTHYEKRQLTCRDFPLDARDLRLTRVPCGHYFDPEPKEKPRANSAD
jgi:hypothetical protein